MSRTKVSIYAAIALALLILIFAILLVRLPTAQQRQVSAGAGSAGTASVGPSIGSEAPNGELVLVNGTVRSISYFRGRPLLVWFVATWCSSCFDGVYALNNSIGFFVSHNVTILVVELYQDLGYPGPNITQFILEAGGSYAYEHGYIIPAMSTYGLTATYDPQGYPDIYYLISPSGEIVFIGSEPSLTMNQLMYAVLELSGGR